MYIDWFKLTRLPFRLRPDPDFLYLGGGVTAVFNALRAAVATGHGTLSLCADEGVGKTTFLHAIAAKIGRSTSVARVQQSDLTADELLETLREQFRLPQSAAAHEHRAELQQFIAAEYARGRTVAILVDGAHQVALPTLRELLQLAGSDPNPLLILAGEPELTRQLEALASEGAAPPLTASLRVPRLALSETEGYIKHRLTIAGSGVPTLFESDTFAEIQRYTGGTPQLINVICDYAMVIAAAHNSPRVGLSEIRDALRELKWVEFAAGTAAPTGGENVRPHPRVAAELHVQQGGKSVKRVPLKPGRLIIGRTTDAGLQLDSDSVSREHCQIITTAEQSFVEDLNSTNGVVVNGTLRRLHRLSAYDQIVIGDHMLTYMESTADK